MHKFGVLKSCWNLIGEHGLLKNTSNKTMLMINESSQLEWWGYKNWGNSSNTGILLSIAKRLIRSTIVGAQHCNSVVYIISSVAYSWIILPVL